MLKRLNVNMEKGNVLLLALLVMAGIMTAGLSIGAIILNEIRQARNVDFSTVAFYAAESGVEQALYKIRKEDAVLSCPTGTCDASGYCGSGEPCAGDIENGKSAFSGSLDNQSSWSRTITDKETPVYGKIKKDETFQVDLYDPEGGTAAGVESMEIDWTPECTSSSPSIIEVGYIAWNPSMGWLAESEKKFEYSYSSPPLAPSVFINGFAADKAYRVRIKALFCDISNLAVTAWSIDNGLGLQKDIPARIVLNSTGSYGTLRQAVKMTMPRKSPMSGLYDYVLFSECSLVKGEPSLDCP